MADESNIILNMPFDEAAGSTIAYDYSKTRADGTVVEADFTGGKQGNCIKFDGNGHCDIDKNVIPLTGNFTLLARLNTSKKSFSFVTKSTFPFAFIKQLRAISRGCSILFSRSTISP